MITQQILAIPFEVQEEVKKLNKQIESTSDRETICKLVAKRDQLLEVRVVRSLVPGDEF